MRPGILEPDANGTIFRFFEVRPERQHGSPEDREREAQERLAAMSETERAAARGGPGHANSGCARNPSTVTITLENSADMPDRF